jgi:hypothetical protein
MTAIGGAAGRLLVAGCALGAAAAQEIPAGARSPRDVAALFPEQTVALVDLLDAGECLAALERAAGWSAGELPPRVRGLLSLVQVGARLASGASLEDLLAAAGRGPVAVGLVVDGGRPFPIVVARLATAGLGARLAERLQGRAAADWRDGVLTVAPGAADLEAVLAARAAGRSLGGKRGFAAARPALAPGRALRVHVDLAALRARAERPLWQRAPPAARLLLGPLAHVFDHAARFDAVLAIGKDDLELHGAVDASVRGSGAPAQRLLAADGPRSLPAASAATLGMLALDRSLRSYFAGLDEILEPGDAAQVRAGLAIADTLLGGASLSDDVLGNIAEPLTLLAVEHEADSEVVPRIRLPGFALVASLRDKRAHVLLERAAHALHLINSNERRQQGRKPFRFRAERIAGERALVAEPDEWTAPGDPPTEYNLSLALLAAHDHLVLATTRQAAAAVVAALRAGAPAQTASGDRLALHGAAVARALAANRAVLALNAVLQEGKTPAQARADLEIADFVLRGIGLVELAVEPGDGRTALRARIVRAAR